MAKDPSVDPTSLGNLLMRGGMVSREQIQAALIEKSREEDRYLGETMVEMGFISRQVLVTYLNQQMLLRSKSRTEVLRAVGVAASGTLALSGSLDSLTELASQVLQKLK